MNFLDLHDAAMNTLQKSGIAAPSAVTADAVYLAAVMAQLINPEAKPLEAKKRGSFVAPPTVKPDLDIDILDQTILALSGKYVQCSSIFIQAYGRPPSQVEAASVGAYLRAKGFQAFRRAGKTLFIL